MPPLKLLCTYPAGYPDRLNRMNFHRIQAIPYPLIFLPSISNLKLHFMLSKNSTLTWRWMEQVWNQGREEAIDEMMDANAEIHGIEDIKEKGTAAFKEFFRNFRTQFPQIHLQVDEVVAQDDYETSRCTVDATNANGQQVHFAGMTCVRIKDGKIAEGWNNFDFLSMYQQMGFKMVSAAEQTA